MNRPIFAALVAAAMLLSACAGPNGGVQIPTQQQFDQAQQNINIALTATQKAMCVAQAGANQAAAIAAIAGNAEDAANAAKASAAAGVGCTWANPTPAAPAK